jgi:large subunit ribosomal protein L19
MDKIKLVEGLFERKELQAFNVGDTIKVLVKILEGDKVRIHPFEGTVLEKRGSGASATFTVRKISYGEGVERTFPMYSASIESVEVVRRGKVHRARLFYLRGKMGKAAKVAEQKSEVLAPTQA